MPTYKNVVVTYTAIDGNEALVGVTGTICDPNQTPSTAASSRFLSCYDVRVPEIPVRWRSRLGIMCLC